MIKPLITRDQELFRIPSIKEYAIVPSPKSTNFRGCFDLNASYLTFHSFYCFTHCFLLDLTLGFHVSS